MPGHPTPSQTIGPYFGIALPFADGGDPAPAGHPAALTLHGAVYDAEGAPVPDALLEFWQAAPDGSRSGAPGSLRRDGVTFTGFARVPTDDNGRYRLRTLAPGGPPYLALCLFARGLPEHLFTRVYLAVPPGDPLLAALPPERRGTLLATAQADGSHHFDLRLGGPAETVFLSFRPE
ncbi:protocatechuate 3,4-dioxygenase subunit alpha [Streptomyces sp. NPDC052396]|uniref:protocatechuate 3,4-dioxygenase subunit alpha n=1 Tax=Streptomyces sp. NPDC052396 TaxID=3365689 RepID=UPI0037D5BEB3